jgi:addiction module HigA family antidote
MGGEIKLSYQPDYAVTPGESLKELIDSLSMSQKEMATRLEMTEQSLVRILKGDQPITYETAERLEMVTGTPASFWNNLEALYREQLAKIAQYDRLEAEIEWLDIIPLAVLRKRGRLSKTRDKTTQLKEVLGFFGVSSVSAWHDIWGQPAVAARRSKCFESRPGHAAVWIRLGELEANNIECAPYDRTKFKESVFNIRGLTLESPEVFANKMRRECAKAGVALAFIPEISKVPWSGATKWITPNKAMILLNLRGKKEDKFWFSFFHEAYHVLYDGKKGLYINDGKQADEREKQADAFAAEILIPAEYNDVIRVIRSHEELQEIAAELEIATGIVAGRFQHLTKKWQWFNDEIKGLIWSTK